jgi:sugar lactone lactonase YvrE
MMAGVPAPETFAGQPFFDPPTESLKFLPEGPRVLQHRPGHLGWVAIQHAAGRPTGSLNVLNLATRENVEYPLPARPGFFCETATPGLLLAGLERRLVLFDLNTATLHETGIEVTTDERVIINDGLAVPGGVFFGTKHLEFNEKIAALYYFDAASRRVTAVTGGQICSNGKYYCSERRLLVDVDSLPRTITEYQLDAAMRFTASRLITPSASLPAVPDGLRPAPDGQSVIVAYYNPDSTADGLAQQIALADGAVLAEWRLPHSPRVTCPEFVAVDGRVHLLFTTAVEGMPAAERATAIHAGKLFLAPTAFPAMPAPPPLLHITL